MTHLLRQLLRRLSRNRSTGTVTLVGAGPGDPELLTLKALRALQRTDVVVYDKLVSAQILRLIPAGTRRIYVGKSAGHHAMRQEEINQLLVLLARRGDSVVRLKGGDPFTFGRGGEEMLALRQASIPVTVIPGITAAAGCAAQAGIPLTDRHFADSVCYVTATRRVDAPDTNWKDLASDPARTLVFYMGLGAAETIASQLIHHGLPDTTPAVLIENGTTTSQREVFSCLRTLATDAVIHRLRSPCLIIVGQVTTLAHNKVEHAAAQKAHGPMLDGRDLPLANLSQVRGKDHETHDPVRPGPGQRATALHHARESG